MKIVTRVMLGTVFALCAFPAKGAANDTLSIVWDPRGVRITINGAANKDYAVDWCSDLSSGQWNALATGATSSSGTYFPADAGSVGQVSRFYRARTLAPITTSTPYSVGDWGAVQTITLGGVDPLGGVLQAFIDKLPMAGKLEQFDGTVISRPNTQVTDSQNRVLYVQGNSTDPYLDSFAYHLRRASNGVTSSPQTVAVGVGNHAPVLDNSRVSAVEDVPMFFQLTATDVDPGDTLTYKVILPTQGGRLYQVAADNQTKGDLISPGAQNIVVTNPGGYLCYVPMLHASGTSYEYFQWTAYDSHGANGGLGIKYIDLQPVNYPPTANSLSVSCDQVASSSEVGMSYSDIESGTNVLVGFTSLPDKGTLYYDAPSFGNKVVIGQLYSDPGNYRFSYVSDHPLDWGVPYTHFTYYVQDPGGLQSAEATVTINIPYTLDQYPAPTTAASYDVKENSNVVILLSGSAPGDPTGKTIDYYIWILPKHGKLYVLYAGTYHDFTGVTLPSELGGNPIRVKYVPDANYVGADSFSFQLRANGRYALQPAVVGLNVVP